MIANAATHVDKQIGFILTHGVNEAYLLCQTHCPVLRVLYLLLLCIIIWRHIHARPNVYHARLRDHMQEVDHVTCVHKSGLYRNNIFMLRKRRQFKNPRTLSAYIAGCPRAGMLGLLR